MFNTSLSCKGSLSRPLYSLDSNPIMLTCLTLLEWRSFIYSFKFVSTFLWDFKKTSIDGLKIRGWLCSSSTFLTTHVPSLLCLNLINALQPVLLLSLSRCRSESETLGLHLPSRTHWRYRLPLLSCPFLMPKPVCFAYAL